MREFVALGTLGMGYEGAVALAEVGGDGSSGGVLLTPSVGCVGCLSVLGFFSHLCAKIADLPLETLQQ